MGGLVVFVVVLGLASEEVILGWVCNDLWRKLNFSVRICGGEIQDLTALRVGQSGDYYRLSSCLCNMVLTACSGR